MLVKANAVVHTEHVVAVVAFYRTVNDIDGHTETRGAAFGFVGGVWLPFSGHHIVCRWF